jgi:hypothetical protein
MNRATQRAEERRARRELADLGCTCHASITDAPIEQTKAIGAQLGWLIRHDAGCPFGDSVLSYNRAGIVPTMFVEGLTRCAR